MTPVDDILASERAWQRRAERAEAENERLREELEALRLIYPEGTADRLTFLELENKRLRAANQ